MHYKLYPKLQSNSHTHFYTSLGPRCKHDLIMYLWVKVSHEVVVQILTEHQCKLENLCPNLVVLCLSLPEATQRAVWWHGSYIFILQRKHSEEERKRVYPRQKPYSLYYPVSKLASHYSCPILLITPASLMAQWCRTCLTMQKTQVWSLSQEASLEKEMTTHFSILAWEIPWTHGVTKSQTA